MTWSRAACPMCGGQDVAETLVAHERQFGLPGEFTYARCTSCRSLWLVDPPEDLGAYYPDAYYSFDAAATVGLVGRLKAASARTAITGRGFVGRMLGMVQPAASAGLHHWLRRAGVTHDSRILDVGSGGGALLAALAGAGYRDLTGVDPFIASDATHGGVRLLRRTVERLDETFDLVMMHHALEHVPDPAATLRALRDRLRTGGHCLVRVPVADSEALRIHGERWVQLDAPRHLVIPSAPALVALAARRGLELVEQRHDSTAIQYWGSRLYERDVPLSRAGAHLGWFGRQRGRWRARRANARGEGDQAAFLFRAVPG